MYLYEKKGHEFSRFYDKNESIVVKPSLTVYRPSGSLFVHKLLLEVFKIDLHNAKVMFYNTVLIFFKVLRLKLITPSAIYTSQILFIHYLYSNLVPYSPY